MPPHRILTAGLLLLSGWLAAADDLGTTFSADDRLEVKGTPWLITEVKPDTLRLRPLPLAGEPAQQRRLRRGERVSLKGRTLNVVEANAQQALLTLPGEPTQTLGAFITPVDASASSFQSPMSPQKTIDSSGWAETYPGSGAWRHAEGSWHGGGMAWSSQGGAQGGWITFDLGQSYSIDGAYVWNYNEGGGWNTRSMSKVRVQVSADGKAWTTVGDYELACAPGQNGYAGQAVPFGKTVDARQVRFESLGNYRNGENVGLAEVRFSNAKQKAPAPGSAPWKPTYARPKLPTAKQGTPLAKGENLVFPDGPYSVIDLSKPPYSLSGDGSTDVTATLNKAFEDYTAKNAILYLPNGVYLVSDTIRWGGGNDMKAGGTAKFTVLQGQSRDGTILRLLDSCMGFDGGGKPVVNTGWAPAQRFANEVRNLTIDTGVDNPGATALQFIANNQGGAYDLCLRSGDGQGVVGLDLGYTDEQGPSLMRNIVVKGFDVGMSSATSVASYTAENITLEDQNVIAFKNGGQPSSIRRLISKNSVPAVMNGSGLLTLIDAELTGKGPVAAKAAAVTNLGAIFVRDLKTSGYQLAIDDKTAKRILAGPAVAEYRSSEKPFGNGPATSLKLPVEETPELPWDAPATWARPETFGGKPDDGQDDAAAIQQAIDTGATTLFLGHGAWHIGTTIHMRGKLRRVIGGRCWLIPAKPLQDSQDGMFQLDNGDSPVVIVERIATSFDGGTFAFFVHNAKRTLVLRQIIENFQGGRVGGYRTGPDGTGDVFFEDVCTGHLTISKQRAWARQLNNEGHGTKVVNNGGTLWVLGFKSEKRDTLFINRGGGSTEVLGGLMQTSDGGSQEPMFLNEGGSMSVVFCETNWSNSPYSILVRQVKNGQTSELAPNDPGFKGFRPIFYEGR